MLRQGQRIQQDQNIANKSGLDCGALGSSASCVPGEQRGATGAESDEAAATAQINPRLAAAARARLARPGLGAIEQKEGDGAQGFGSDLYDAIVLTGSTPILPDALVAQLKPGGRLFAVVGDLPVMTARLVRSVGPESVTATDLFETVIDPLKNAAQPVRFRF